MLQLLLGVLSPLSDTPIPGVARSPSVSAYGLEFVNLVQQKHVFAHAFAHLFFR